MFVRLRPAYAGRLKPILVPTHKLAYRAHYPQVPRLATVGNIATLPIHKHFLGRLCSVPRELEPVGLQLDQRAPGWTSIIGVGPEAAPIGALANSGSDTPPVLGYPQAAAV